MDFLLNAWEWFQGAIDTLSLIGIAISAVAMLGVGVAALFRG